MIKGKLIALAVVNAALTSLFIVAIVYFSTYSTNDDRRMAGGFMGAWMLVTIWQFVLALPLLKSLKGKSVMVQIMAWISLLPLAPILIGLVIFAMFDDKTKAEINSPLASTGV